MCSASCLLEDCWTASAPSESTSSALFAGPSAHSLSDSQAILLRHGSSAQSLLSAFSPAWRNRQSSRVTDGLSPRGSQQQSEGERPPSSMLRSILRWWPLLLSSDGSPTSMVGEAASGSWDSSAPRWHSRGQKLSIT